MLDPLYIRERLSYDPLTGILRWKAHPDQGRHQKKYTDKVAGTISDGYLKVGIKGKNIFAHRLAWVIFYGEWPNKGFEIDHKNRNRTDNRIDNLRLVTRKQNSHNQDFRERVQHKNNTSGHVGVYYHKNNNRWVAYIRKDSKNKHLGSFNTKEEAILARNKAIEMHEIKIGDF